MSLSANKTKAVRPETAGTVKKRKVLFFDIECAGVSGLCSGRGFVCCFGYRWEGEKSKVITLTDYPGTNCQDDKKLIEAAYQILQEAEPDRF